MAYLFLDESGDLGFNFSKKKTSHVFVITCLFTQDKRPIEKIVKKTHFELRRKYKKKFGILHCVKEKPITRVRLLKRLCEKDCGITIIYLNKKKVYTKLHDEKAVLYNYVTNILLDRICTKKLISTQDHIHLVVSRRETNKFMNENFKSYINSRTKSKRNIDISINIKTPAEEKSLQAADFISWSIFRKYEYGDDSYYRLIKNKIIEEAPLFP
ncbi:DUF3800 domain-containing protein [Candidatus Peregrinibacteria bacterium]|nr:DUF3800 domain-containing protein [Candidatus Peregrinibacteria bacterium]